jgi:hypothetical protein
MAWRASPVSGHWRIDVDGGIVVVTAVPPGDPVADHLWQPRVCPGVGIGVPLSRVASLVDAIPAVVSSSPGANPWSMPGVDHTEGFAYAQGPVGALDEVTGWRPVPGFVVSRHDLFCLGQRLSVLAGGVFRGSSRSA